MYEDEVSEALYSHLSITPSRMRSINQTAVLEYVRVNRMASRSELAEALGLSLPSIVRIVDDLMEKGLVKFSGNYEFSGGRRRPLVEFDTGNNIAVVIEIGESLIRGAIVNLAGEQLERLEIPFYSPDEKTVLETLFRTITPLCDRAGGCNKNFHGVAIAVPGVVQPHTGKVLSAPSVGWEDFALGEILRERYAVPIVVENDSNAAALGEMWFGDNDDLYNLALIQLRKGLGVGLIVDGSIYRGPNNAAGEVGHIVLSPDDFRSTHLSYGPVEQKIAGVGLIEKSGMALRAIKDARAGEVTYQRLFDDYSAGMDWPKQIVGEFVNTLSMVVILVNAMMNCEKIILSGEIMECAQGLIAEIQSKVYSSIVVEKSKIGAMAGLLGGFVALIQRQMDYCILKSVL